MKNHFIAAFTALLAITAMGCSEEDPSPRPPRRDTLPLVIFENAQIDVTVKAVPSSYYLGRSQLHVTGVNELKFVNNREVDMTLQFAFKTTQGTDYVGSVIESFKPLSARLMLGNCKFSAGDATADTSGTYWVTVTYTASTDEVIGHNCEGNLTDVVINYFGGAPEPFVFISNMYHPQWVTVPTDVQGINLARGLEAGQCFLVNVGLDADDDDEYLLQYDEDREEVTVIPGHTMMLDGELTFAQKDRQYVHGLAGYGFCLDASGTIVLAPEPQYEPPDGIEAVYMRLKSYEAMVTPVADCNFRSDLPPQLLEIPMTMVSAHYSVYTWPEVELETTHTCEFSESGGANYTPNTIIVEVNGWQVRTPSQPYNFTLDERGVPVLDFNEYQCTFTPNDRVRVSGEVALIYGTIGDYKSSIMSPNGRGGYTTVLYVPDSFFELDVMWERGAYDALTLQFGFPDNTIVSQGTLECEGTVIQNTITFADDAKWTADFNNGAVSQWNPNPSGDFIFIWDPPF